MREKVRTKVSVVRPGVEHLPDQVFASIATADAASSAEHEIPGHEGPRIGVSLSGGGNRAALFGTGAVLALTDSGAHKQVRMVSSVSGGSLVNARLGSKLSWPAADSAKVHSTLTPLVSTIASTGFTMPGIRFFLLVVVLQMLFMGLAWSGLMWLAIGGAWPFWFGAILFGSVAGLGNALFLLHVGRQHVVLRRFNRGLVGTSTKVAALADDDSIQHVICSTDLETASHFFFTGHGVESEAWGLGSAENILLSFAVECSAAFPLVFPVMGLRTKKLAFDPDKKVPSVLKLVDGGVHDNLGLPWLTSRMASSMGSNAQIDAIVAVNSSWDRPYKRLSVFKTARVFEVMHQSNWSFRAHEFLEQLALNVRGTGALVSIGESPYALLERVEESIKSNPPSDVQLIRNRIAASRDFLTSEGFRPKELELLCRSAAATKTTLGRIPAPTATELLLHGYLSTAVACHVLIATALPPADAPRRLERLIGARKEAK